MTMEVKKIGVTGGSGFVGSALTQELHRRGYDVLLLSRQELLLPPLQLARRLDGCDGVINLAGAPVLRRWSSKYKKIMMASRIDLTRNLVASFRFMGHPPKMFISTSATGIYGNEGIHTEEENNYGTGFLSQLAEGWEEEALAAEGHGVRTLIFRFGVVLGGTGGPVADMVLPFKLGLGGRIGSGEQSFSWIHLDDLLRAYLFVLEDGASSGVYNLVAPNPSTNRGMTQALGKALDRPTFLNVPGFILQLFLAEGATMLTEGQSALPKRLLDAGFVFAYEEIDQAMQGCVSS